MRISDWSSDMCSSDLFYICSLSCRSIIYKGLFFAESLSVFYPDLQDERLESRVAIFQQRYSTNTFPRWWLAQPFRPLAHNGEITTIRGNKHWMKSQEIKMAYLALGRWEVRRVGEEGVGKGRK